MCDDISNSSDDICNLYYGTYNLPDENYKSHDDILNLPDGNQGLYNDIWKMQNDKWNRHGDYSNWLWAICTFDIDTVRCVVRDFFVIVNFESISPSKL